MNGSSSVAQPALLWEGKSKRLYGHPQREDWLIAEFKDDVTAFNGEKHALVAGKGALNARMSGALFGWLNQQGEATAWVQPGDTDTTLVYHRLTMLPLEVIVRNQAYGSLLKRYPSFYQPGEPLRQPLVEFCYKSDEAGDPPVSEALIAERGWLPAGVTVAQLRHQALRLNARFVGLFASVGIVCADFKLEFGVDAQGTLRLGDELSPDGFRLRDAQTGAVLDKDVFRLGLGDLADAYATVWQRLEPVLTRNAQLTPAHPDHPPLAAQQQPTCTNSSRLFQVDVSVRTAPHVLHPESRAIFNAIQSLQLGNVQQVQAGKQFRLTLAAADYAAAEALVHTLATRLLSNPVIEQYAIEHLASLPAAAEEMTP